MTGTFDGPLPAIYMPGGATAWRSLHGATPLPPVSPKTADWLRAADAAVEAAHAAEVVAEEGSPHGVAPAWLPPGSQGTLQSLAEADSAVEFAAPAPAAQPGVTFGAATYAAPTSAGPAAAAPLSGGSTAPDSVQTLGPEWRTNGDSAGRTPFVGSAQLPASPAASPPSGNPARRRNLSFAAQQVRAANDSPANNDYMAPDSPGLRCSALSGLTLPM